MYYSSVYSVVHFHAGKMGIHGQAREELPRLWPLLKKDGYLLLPVALLILRLVIGRSAFDAALWAILLAIVLGMFREHSRLLALSPLLGRAVGVSGRDTARDWAEIRAERERQRVLNEGGATEEAERAVAAARAGEGGGLLRENWMLGAGAAVFAVLLYVGAGAGQSVFWSLVATVILSSPRLMNALEKASLNLLVIGVTAGVMGVVLAGVALPGLGIKFSSIMLSHSGILEDAFGFAGTRLPVAILLCALASYVLGMGMTISASYVILSLLAVPALVELGVSLVNAHLIILWLSLDSALTPPFALGAFIAGGLAGADPVRTGFTALKLAKALYIIPYLIAYSPILMDPGSSWGAILAVWATGFMGFYCVSAALEGFVRRRLSAWERVLFLLAGTLVFFQVWEMQVARIGLMAAGVGLQYLGRPETAAVGVVARPSG